MPAKDSERERDNARVNLRIGNPFVRVGGCGERSTTDARGAIVGRTPRDPGLIVDGAIQTLAGQAAVRIDFWAVRFLPDVRFALRGFRRSAGDTAIRVALA